jgi:integrase
VNRTIPRGVKQVVKRLASGRIKKYWYHRATGRRVSSEPYSAAALQEVAELDAYSDRAQARRRTATNDTIGSLWEEYAGSPEFLALAPRTQSDYRKVRDWLGAAAYQAALRSVRPDELVRLRDKAFRAHGRRFANYTIQVLRLLFSWGKLRGKLAGNPFGNPASEIPPLKRPKHQPHQNRAWEDGEVAAFLEYAPHYLKLPFMLGCAVGMREGDMVRLTWRSYDGHTLDWLARKNSERCIAPVAGVLKRLLDAAPKGHVQICLNSRGRPWASENSFRSAFFAAVRRLQADGRIKPNATFHGLRHSLGVAARNAGHSEFEVAAALGDRSTAMAQVYGRDASRQAAQTQVLRGLQERLQNLDLETSLETERGGDDDKPLSG